MNFIDLSLLTDGLIIEREKNITIDVAYIYFASEKRKYILADTPGHLEYTRNMITGASQSQVCLIMIDAKKGLQEQTKRHLYIACLLGLQEVIFCVNKMDLLGYEQAIFESYLSDLQALINSFHTKNTHFSFLPISALEGENIAFPTQKMPWYKGECLLSLLEKIEIKTAEKPMRFGAQGKIETLNFQGITGKLLSGNLKVGDNLVFLQGNTTAKLTAIYKGEKKVAEAKAGESLVLATDSPFLPERGEIIIVESAILQGKTAFSATLCWLDEVEGETGKKYILQQGTFEIFVFIEKIKEKMNFLSMQYEAANSLKMNDIAAVFIRTETAIFIENFAENAAMGRFILIDCETNRTVALGLKNT